MSPSFQGFSVGASFQGDDSFNIVGNYSGAFAGVNVKASYVFQNEEASGTNGTTHGGSISAQHSSGLHVSFAHAQRNITGGGRTPKYMRVSGGYEAKLNSLGKTDFYVQWMDNEDVAAAGRDATELNIGATQALDSVGGKIGIVWSNTDVDDTANTDYNDVDVIYLETQFNF